MNRKLFLGAVLGGVAVALLGGCPSGTPTPGEAALTFSLDPSLNHEGDVRATAINTAQLLDTAGNVVATATISSGAAVFSLSGVSAGDYFIRVNGLDTDLVPVRIDDPAVSVTETSATTLRSIVIGSLSDPTYRVETFSQVQGGHEVVKYSDGTNVTPAEFAYAIISRKTSPQRLSIRVLGTAQELTSLTSASGSHPGGGNFTQPFADWEVHVQSALQHGEAWNGTDANCLGCHGVSLDTKVAAFANINVASGWCFRCHYGKTGSVNGFIDPNQ